MSDSSRGILTLDINSFMVVCKMGMFDLLQLLKRLYPTSNYVENMLETELVTDVATFVIVQYDNQPSIFLIPVTFTAMVWLNKELVVAQISKAGGERLVHYKVSDTAGSYYYQLFENGVSIERLNVIPDLYEEVGIRGEIQFSSSLRQVSPPSEDYLPEFIDSFFIGEDVLVPDIRAHSYKRGERIQSRHFECSGMSIVCLAGLSIEMQECPQYVEDVPF